MGYFDQPDPVDVIIEKPCEAYDEVGRSTCDFEGEVDAILDGVRVTWICPKCGYQNEYEDDGALTEPDPDLAMDAARDAALEDRYS